jgi:hypothetical protein
MSVPTPIPFDSFYDDKQLLKLPKHGQYASISKWAKAKVQARMVEAAIALDLKYTRQVKCKKSSETLFCPVNTMKTLILHFNQVEEVTIADQDHMYDILYECFDDGWEVLEEETIMKQMNLSYDKASLMEQKTNVGAIKGDVSKLFTVKHNDQMKRIRKGVIAKHPTLNVVKTQSDGVAGYDRDRKKKRVYYIASIKKESTASAKVSVCFI